MRARSCLGSIATSLASAVLANRSIVGERLRGLARDGTIGKGCRRPLAPYGRPGGGRAAPFGGVAELRPAAPEAEVLERDQPNSPEFGRVSAPAFPPWIRPLEEYDRRERHEFEMSRYG
jgi:hypothetical protein